MTITTIPAQTVTFGAAPTVVVGGTGSASATSDGDGAISYTSTTLSVCTVDASTGVVTGVAAGTANCTIQADAAATVNWAAGTSTQTFDIGQGGAPDSGGGTAQTPASSCVTPGGTKALPQAGSKTLMKPECESNADQPIGARIDSATPRLSQRGDLRYYRLYCQVGKKKTTKTKATGYGDGSRYCTSGSLNIRTYGTKLKLRITWYAPATGDYAAYRKTKTYKT